MAKNEGKKFEEDFIQSVPESIYKQRLRDMGGMYRRVKNICDYILYDFPVLYLLELKSCKGKSLPFANIQPHQLDGLGRVKDMQGIVAGFIVNFRDVEETYYISVKQMIEFKNNAERRSYPLQFFRDKGLLIPQQIKITRYTYDTDPLIQLGEEVARNEIRRYRETNR